MDKMGEVTQDLVGVVTGWLEDFGDPGEKMAAAEACGEYVGQTLRGLLAAERAKACAVWVAATSETEVAGALGISQSKVHEITARGRREIAAETMVAGMVADGTVIRRSRPVAV